MDSRLSQFVKDALARNMSINDIKQVLLEYGWPKSLVEATLKIHETHEDDLSVIKAEHLSKSFKKNLILNDISLNIKKGEILGIIGLSGAGKTTLLNLLIGFLKPDLGSISLKLGVNEDPKRLFGIATQEMSFYNKLSVEENLFYFADLYDLDVVVSRENITHLLDMLDLTSAKNTLAENLSKGMKKRLDIACSLIHNPKILILDEPTSDLDPIRRDELWDMIKRINSKGTTIVLSSHFILELESLCDRIGVLHKGKILKIGTPEEIRSIFANEYEIVLETKNAIYTNLMELLNKTEGISKFKKRGNKLIVITTKSRETLKYILAFIDRSNDTLLYLDFERPTVKDLFEGINGTITSN